MSLSGRSALNQNNGLATASAVHSAAVLAERRAASGGSSASRLPNNFISGNTASAPKTAPSNASAFASDGMTARAIFPSAMKIG